MTVTVYHDPACGTSRNVLAMIRDPGEEPTVIECLNTPPSRRELVSLIERMGIGIRDLLRRKDTPYDVLGLDDPDLSDGQILDANVAHPNLTNRPIVVTPLGIRLCRPSETVLDILPNPRRGAFTKEDGMHVVGSAGDRIPRDSINFRAALSRRLKPYFMTLFRSRFTRFDGKMYIGIWVSREVFRLMCGCRPCSD
jgi:arsenate reductase (glutaredoxin)